MDILDSHCNPALLSAFHLVTFLYDFLFMASKTAVFLFRSTCPCWFWVCAVGRFGVLELQTCADVLWSSGDLLSSVCGSVTPLFSFLLMSSSSQTH